MTNRENAFNSSLKMGSVLCLILTLILLNFSSFGNSNLMVNATEPAPLFHVHMIAPTSNPIRMQAAHLIERELESIGISCDLDLLNWRNIGPRSYYDTVGPYNEGGYDIAFIGMTLGNVINHPVDTLMSSFGVDSYPPFGYNMMYWSNATEPGGSQEGLHTWNSYRAGEQNQLLADIRVETNLTTVKEMFDDWQKIYYDAMPQALVYNQLEVHAISAGLYGYDPVLPYPFSSTEDFWTTADYTGTADEVILAAAAGGDEFFSILTGDIYDQYSAAHVWDGLVGVTPSKNTVLPAGTDRTQWMQNRYGITDYLAVYPRLAKDMGNFSSDLLNYTIELDQGHYFHDGHEIDAWDVVFSFQAHLLPELSSLTYSTRKSCFGTDADGMGHGNSSFIAKDTNVDGFYETIDFNFMNPYSPFVIDLLGTAILPEHILGDNDTTHGWTGATAYTGSFDPNTEWQARPDSWQTHSFNTGDPSDAGGFKGPIG
ncbi:MAG: ABC transporter substrate-binding protein, partial [Candidatus Hodarchaeota archaeon]